MADADDSKVAAETERNGGESGEGIKGEAAHFHQTVMGLSGRTWITLVGNRGLNAAEPGEQTPGKAVIFRK